MTKQEENWELYTLCGISWADANTLEEDDRKFLLEKADEIKRTIMENRRQEEQMRQRMQNDARAATIQPQQ
jgi:hypothetical protein